MALAALSGDEQGIIFSQLWYPRQGRPTTTNA
jgi:hypothetical protein